MTVYIILYILLLIGISQKNSKAWMASILLIFAFLLGFRALYVGDDTLMYSKMYLATVAHGYKDYPEPLYGYSQMLGGYFGLDFWEFQFCLSLFMMGVMYYAIKNFSPNAAFSLFVYYGMYFLMYSTNGFRQMFAVSVILLGYALLQKGKKLLFICTILVACGFHASSIIALAALLLGKLKFKSTWLPIICVIISFGIGLFLSDDMLLKLAGNYAHYLQGISSSGMRSEERLFLAMLLCLFWSGLFIICYSSLKDTYRNSFWIKLYFIAIIVNNLCMRMELGLRIVWIFSIGEIIALPIIAAHNKVIPNYTIRNIIILALTIFFFTLLLTNSADVVPYGNILFG